MILRYSTKHDNDYGFPYTFMKKLSDETAFSIYFHQPYDPSNPSGAYRLADILSAETQIKRVNFLRLLARIMTEIQHLTFGKLGM